MFPCYPTIVSPKFLLKPAIYLLLLGTCFGVNNSPAVSVSTKQKQLGIETLRRAVAIARSVDVSSAAPLLTFAGTAAATNPALSKDYYLQAMDMADNMPLTSPNDMRVSVQNSSVAGIATNDPILAMQLFRRIDKPDWTAFPESDMRSVAASAIVRSLVAKTGTSKADELAALLAYAGDTGEYPYISASTLLSALEEHHQRDLISKVFSDALLHIQEDGTFISAPGDFTDLLLSHSNSLPPALCMAAVRAAVEAAGRFDAKQKEHGSAEQRTMVLDTGKSQVAIRKQATYIALRLLPLASRLDDRLADELKHRDSDLQAATAGASNDDLAKLASSRSSIVVGEGGVASAQIAGVMRDQAESRNLVDLSQQDPGKAIASLSGIQDTAIKVRTEAAIAENLIHSDAPRAAAMLESAWSDSERIMDTKEHIVALEIIAGAWSSLNDSEHVRSVVSDGLSLAQKMYSSSKNEKVDAFVLRPGLDELAELTGLLARVDAQAGLQQAESIDSPEARAYVLLSIARVLLTFPPISPTKSQTHIN